MSRLANLVFSQTDDATPPIDRLSAQARAHFDGNLSRKPAARPGAPARLSYSTHGADGDFDVSSRPAVAEDVAAARDAERSGPIGGLGDLAARCRTVWIVEPFDEPPEWLILDFLALLASVALGPILTADGRSLLGVRSARERSNAMRGGPSLMR